MSGEIVQVTGYLTSFKAGLYVLAAAEDEYQGEVAAGRGCGFNF
jgi:hypothetical protein